MRTHVDPTLVERLRAISVALRRVYSPDPVHVPEKIKDPLRRLRDSENGGNERTN